MCDTVVATADVTEDGVTIFGKNSDREPNEAQHLRYVPAADHPPGERVRCTDIEIPQVEHTCAVLLSKPFWMWGAEMGTNEHGVTIGNEAVFAKVPYVKKGALLGMDLLRLGLERAKTAPEALAVITGLMAEFGQGGNCGFRHKLYYHNSYIIADPGEAWVLETAGPHWAAKQIQGVYTISNGITLGNEFDLASPDLVSHAVDKGWCKSRDDFDFARCYSDFLYTKFSDCRSRCSRTTDLLASRQGEITPAAVMSLLRDHGQDRDWRPDSGVTGADVCMHAGFGPVRGSQTVGSMVSHLHPGHPTHFFTATAAPCTGVFKPVWMDALLPDTGPDPEGVYNDQTLFWRHELLHRATIRDYPRIAPLYQPERDALEKRFVDRALEIAAGEASEREAFAARCFEEAAEAESRWTGQASDAPVVKSNGFLYASAWKTFNRQAQMPA